MERILSWPFEVSPGLVVDSLGQRSESFDAIVHTRSRSRDTPTELSSDTVACVVDVLEELSSEEFRKAYRRIATAKALHKRFIPGSDALPLTTTTLGIVLCRDSQVPIESLADELDLLNRVTPAAHWADMVAVLSRGVLSYGVQFPGESVSGDLLPPAAGALATYIPPSYVVTLMRPTGDYTFNTLCSFLIAHLGVFSPGAGLPDWDAVRQGATRVAVTHTGYQYNLEGDLVPVPRDLYEDRILPNLPLRIEDRAGRLLATVQFIPWQDGGVILLRGSIDLGALLMHLPVEDRRRGGVIRREDRQISYVLPIEEADFSRLLRTLQQQAGMSVRETPGTIVMRKLADEGSTSPFVARLAMWILRLRAQVLDRDERERFDAAYFRVLDELWSTRASVREIGELWEEHLQKVREGEAARVEGRTIHVQGSVDRELGRLLEAFVNSAARAMKAGMQSVTNTLGVNLGFFFQKESRFLKGLEALRLSDQDLTAYLRESRPWSERLVAVRNRLEHEGWKLSPVNYSVREGVVQAEEPTVLDQSFTAFVRFTCNRVLCFVEEITSHLLQKALPAEVSIAEREPAERVADAPERFEIILAGGGLQPWRISYHEKRFEEC